MARSNHSGSVERVYHDEHREAMAQSQYSNYIQYQSQQNMGGGSSQQQNYGGNPNQNPYQSQSNLNNNVIPFDESPEAQSSTHDSYPNEPFMGPSASHHGYYPYVPTSRIPPRVTSIAIWPISQ
eukprot:290953_1